MSLLRKTFVVFLVLSFSTPSYATSNFCIWALQKTGGLLQVLTPDQKLNELVKPAASLAREVLGDLLQDKHSVEVRQVTCLGGAGCKFSPLWNVIQMDQEPLMQNPEAFGAIYVHELAHSIQFRSNPKIQKLRNELGGLRDSQLAGWTKAERYRKKISKSLNDGGFWGLWYFFTNAEAKLYEKEKLLEEKMTSALEKLGYAEDESKLGAVDPIAFLQASTGELFADLVSCSAYSDPDIIAKSLKVIDGARHPERENSKASEILETSDWVKIRNEDVHDFFTPARRLIWEQHLKGKSKSQAQKILAILDKHTQEWPAAAATLKDQNDQFDKNQLNRIFLRAFENRLEG
jgi:hypothetical protein